MNIIESSHVESSDPSAKPTDGLCTCRPIS